MTLDIAEITADWKSPPDAICARVVTGSDGNELVQLRVDLGVLQMFPDGRPDGGTFHACPTVLAYLQRELARDHEPSGDAWHEIQRELQQFNYRRLALANVAEDAAPDDASDAAIPWLRRALRDIDHCLGIIRVLEEHLEHGAGPHSALIPALLFNRARLRARTLSAQKRIDEAIEAAERGADALRDTLVAIGFEPQQCESDPALVYLRQIAGRLRRRLDTHSTLREQLEHAIAAEDFEAAARIRDELRGRGLPPRELPPPDEP